MYLNIDKNNKVGGKCSMQSGGDKWWLAGHNIQSYNFFFKLVNLKPHDNVATRASDSDNSVKPKPRREPLERAAYNTVQYY